MKKALTVLFSVLLIFTLAANCSASSAELSVGEADANPGETVKLTVFIKNNPGFCYLRVRPEYDGDALEFIAAEKGELNADDVSFGRNISVEGGSDIKGDGSLFTMTFKVKDGAKPGICDVKLVFIECYNYNEDDVAVTVTDGRINVGAGSSAHTDGAQTEAAAVTAADTKATEKSTNAVTKDPEADKKNGSVTAVIAICAAVCIAAAAVSVITVKKKKQK